MHGADLHLQSLTTCVGHMSVAQELVILLRHLKSCNVCIQGLGQAKQGPEQCHFVSYLVFWQALGQ